MNYDIPKISEKAHISPHSVIIGNVTIEDDVTVLAFSSMRSEKGTSILLEEGSNVQENCVIHVGPEGPVAIVHKGASLGHGCILHGCEIGEYATVGMGAVVMNHAKIGKYAMIGAGCVVTEYTEIPDGAIVIGTPGKVRRIMNEEEIESMKIRGEHYVHIGRMLDEDFKNRIRQS